MISRLPPLVFRLALLVAVAVSAALLIDYFRPLPAFCDVGSGCDKVRASGFGKVLGVPVPLVGLLAFSSIAMLSLSTHPAAARWTRVLTLVGGAGGLVLLSVQAFLLHVFCKLCVAVDIAAVVAAVAVLLSPRSPNTFTTSEARWLWPVATTLAVLLPGGWALLQPSPPVPPEIASLWIPGKINVVEFADFQCPFCRQLHPRMAELLREYDDRVNFVRLNVPLPMHSQAQTAAAAYCCAEDQGKAGAMADALFQAESLTLEACDRLAAPRPASTIRITAPAAPDSPAFPPFGLATTSSSVSNRSTRSARRLRKRLAATPHVCPRRFFGRCSQRFSWARASSPSTCAPRRATQAEPARGPCACGDDSRHWSKGCAC